MRSRVLPRHLLHHKDTHQPLNPPMQVLHNLQHNHLHNLQHNHPLNPLQLHNLQPKHQDQLS